MIIYIYVSRYSVKHRCDDPESSYRTMIKRIWGNVNERNQGMNTIVSLKDRSRVGLSAYIGVNVFCDNLTIGHCTRVTGV